MPTVSHDPHLSNLKHWSRSTWAAWLDWAGLLALGAALLVATWSLGATPAHGPGMAWWGCLAGLQMILHGVWWMVDPQRPRKVHPWAWWPLPFLAILTVHQTWLSPLPWLGRLPLAGWWCAAVGWWVVLHQAGTRRRLWWVFGMGALAALAAFCAGLLQVYLNPHWLPLGRVVSEAFGGQASGSLARPEHLAVLMVLYLPFFLLLAWLPRYPSQARLLAGFCAFLCAYGAILTGTRAAWFGLAVVFLPLPWCLAPAGRRRRRYALRLALLLVAGGLALKVCNETTWALVQTAWRGASPTGAAEAASALRQGWLEHLWIGAGPGLADRLVLASPGAAATAGVAGGGNTWWRMAAETGLAGLVALVGPLGWAGYLLWQAWRQTPWERLGGGAGQPGAAAAPRPPPRHRRHGPAKAPTALFLLGGAWLAVVAGGVAAGFAEVPTAPALLLHMAVLLGLGARFAVPDGLPLSRWHHWGVLGLAFCLLAAGALFRLTYPAGTAQFIHREAEELLQPLLRDRTRLRAEPGLASLVASRFERAMAIEPDRAESWIGLAELRLLQASLDPAQQETMARLARREAAQALSLDPASARALAAQAMAGEILGEPPAVVRADLARAAALAPADPRMPAYLREYDQRQEEIQRTGVRPPRPMIPRPAPPDPFSPAGQARLAELDRRR